jgi:tight adherence protein B
MKRLLAALGAVALIATAAPAYAAESGQIDHVESTDDGKVKLLYSVPGGAPDLDSVQVTVDGQPVEASAAPVQAGQIQRTAVLALDVSDSMRGERFAAAQQAARTYLESAPDDVSIGLVTFAGDVTVVASPTQGHDSLVNDVATLSLARGTQLYDGVLEAITQAGSEGARQVIVLSDGADTSSTPLAEVVESAEASGITVNVVALEQGTSARSTLRRITDASNGSVLPADDPAALAKVFATEAEALAQQVLVKFSAPVSGDATVEVSLDADGQTYTDTAFTSFAASAAVETADAQEPLAVEASQPLLPVGRELMVAGAAAVGLAVAALLVVAFGGKPRQKQSLADTLNYYSGTGAPPAPEQVSRAQFNVRDSAVALAEQVVQKGDFESKLNARLNAAGTSLTAAEWLLAHAGIVVLGALLGFLLGGGSWIALLLSMVLAAVGPWIFLGLKRSRRLRAFGSQLADTLQLMSGGLSAGLSLPQAVDTVVREGAEPMSGELRRALVEQRLGVGIEDALDGVAERMSSKDFAWVVMAIRIQREVGGNLAELLNTVAATLREREYLRRQVISLSAEGRLSAWILGGLPPMFVAYLAATRPDYLEPLVTTPIGWGMTGMAILMLVTGAFWLAKTVKVEV